MNHKHSNKKSETAYYILLILLVLFTSGMAFLLMPLLILGDAGISYVVVTILGLVFGLFITFFIKDLENLSKHHHAGIWLVVLIGSIINFVLAYNSGNALSTYLNIQNYISVNPLVTGALFSISFFTPYFFFLLEQHHAFHTAKKVHKQ